MNYVFTIKDLHYVQDEGFPKDEDICFVLWTDKDGNYDCFVGCYDENKNNFYADYGMGSTVVKGKSVIAWKLFDADNILIKKEKK